MKRKTERLVGASPFVLLLLIAAPAQAQSNCGEKWPDDGFNLAGRLNDAPIEAYLDLGYPAHAEDKGISGVFFFSVLWKPGSAEDKTAFNLDGTFTPDWRTHAGRTGIGRGSRSGLAPAIRRRQAHDRHARGSRRKIQLRRTQRRARNRLQRTRTVLQSSFHAGNTYRLGRNIGNGSGITFYLFILGDRWVHIQSHAGVADGMGEPGPVIFEGSGVTERLIRSIRPRR